MKFNSTNKLERVDLTESFTILVFSNSSLILTKNNFEIVKQVEGFYQKTYENNYSLFMISRELNYLKRFCFVSQTETIYKPPSNHQVTNFTVCPQNSFIVATTKHMNSARNSSLVFWVMNNSKFLFQYDFKKIMRSVKILSESKLILNSKHGVRIFDTNCLKEIMNLEFEQEIKNLFVKNQDEIFLKFLDKSYRKVWLNSKQEKKIKKFGQKSILVFLKEYKKFYEMQDIYSMIHITN